MRLCDMKNVNKKYIKAMDWNRLNVQKNDNNYFSGGAFAVIVIWQKYVGNI